MLDDHILRYLPCKDFKLFREMRKFPYDEWSPRFQSLLSSGTIGYEGSWVIRLQRDGVPILKVGIGKLLQHIPKSQRL